MKFVDPTRPCRKFGSRLFLKNGVPGKLACWGGRPGSPASLLAGVEDRGPRQACLLGWKKSRTSLNLLRRVEVKILYLASMFINPAGDGGTGKDRVP
jgi:hypothetical protein